MRPHVGHEAGLTLVRGTGCFPKETVCPALLGEAVLFHGMAYAHTA